MKYIRTKDGRIIKFGDNEIGYELGTFEIHNKTGIVASYEPIEVLKQADNIQELCDEFVSVYKNFTPKLLEPKFLSPREPLSVSWKNRLEDEHLFKDTVVYGAIWTGKGLIYVAKMNEKGELELL